MTQRLTHPPSALPLPPSHPFPDTQGNSHNIEGDGKKDVGLSSPCDSFLPAISGGYACTGGCGGKGCSGLTQGKCMQGGPYKAYCVKA